MPREARTAPARSRSQRKIDTLEKLRADVDLWVASASADGHAYLVPLSYRWDGSRLTLATPRASRTARNLIRAGWARAALGPTRVVIIEGQVEAIPIGTDPALEDGHARQPASTREASPTSTSTSGLRRTRSRRGAKQTSSRAAISCGAASGSAVIEVLADHVHCLGLLRRCLLAAGFFAGSVDAKSMPAAPTPPAPCRSGSPQGRCAQIRPGAGRRIPSAARAAEPGPRRALRARREPPSQHC